MPGHTKAVTVSKSRKRKLTEENEDEVTAGEGPSSCHDNVTEKLQRDSTDGLEEKEEDNLVQNSEDSVDKDADFEEQAKKKKKNANGRSSVIPNKKKNGAEQCATCGQLLTSDSLRLYEGHPENAVDEFIALTDPRLSIFTGEEEVVIEEDERPTHKITAFAVYDTDGHLCAFDSGLIEKNMLLYFSGYVKPIFDDNPDIQGGVPAKNMGPINEWWVCGFDGGNEALLGISTCYADYYLMQPSESFAPFMREAMLKSFLSKAVIDFLIEHHEEQSSYEDMLNHLQTLVPPVGIPKLDEEALLHHADFVCEQVQSMNDDGDKDDPNLFSLPAMKRFVNLSVGGLSSKAKKTHVGKSRQPMTKKATWSKATTTSLVKAAFEQMFEGQLDQDSKGPRRQRCHICETCQRPDCGSCTSCVNMVKFGGTGTSKQACKLRSCPNMEVQDENEDVELEADDSDDESEDDVEVKREALQIAIQATPRLSRKCTWGACSVTLQKYKIYKKCHLVEAKNQSVKMLLQPGDFIMLIEASPNQPRTIARIMYLYEDLKTKEKGCHIQVFLRARSTILGEAACKNEVVQLEECQFMNIYGIDRKLQVHKVDVPQNWASLGGTPESLVTPFSDADYLTYWYQKAYIKTFGRFIDLPVDPDNKTLQSEFRYCGCCERKVVKKNEHEHLLEPLDSKGAHDEVLYSGVMWRGEILRPGSCVFLDTDAYHVDVYSHATPEVEINTQVDDSVYTEYYRKSSTVIGSNYGTQQPFHVARIVSISKHKEQISLTVAKFYRPENIQMMGGSQHLDFNLLYWSSQECKVKLDLVQGQCWVMCNDNLNISALDWSQLGPHRFYFKQAYNNKSIVDLPDEATHFGTMSTKGKGKGKSKDKPEHVEASTEGVPLWPKISQPLRCLDVFAGCGGLSLGMHQSGATVSSWAIEKDESAANAFKLNNPECQVFTEDCNELLKQVMEGAHTWRGQRLPRKGEVDMICGGPPCQGFSGMNRFNMKQYSIFKNSLVVSLLSYCDFYRPRFFVLENVRNFVVFKQNMVLKLVLKCLHSMGYQCAFGVLQAGNFGVPQSRHRAIIIAAAPGEILPNFPEPTHVFHPSICKLNVKINNKKYYNGCRWYESAPLRAVNIRDAMADLPEIRNGANQVEMAYSSEPLSYLQKLARRGCPVLRDHICKEMSLLVEARISHIPCAAGADWRDLPNSEVRLSDGRVTKKLVYTHKLNQGVRGVCPCSEGGKCDPSYRQDNSLIPWCLPHTGNKYNHWAGLYGRLEWDGFFSTTTTNPEPMGKQGRVLHPDETRVVSVRECARSQGFPDSYRLYGNVLDKHRQIGNAVPPPLAAAIGREIGRSMSAKESQNKPLTERE